MAFFMLLESLWETAYSRTYFRMNRTFIKYIRWLIFFSLDFQFMTLIRVQEMTPMAMPSEML